MRASLSRPGLWMQAAGPAAAVVTTKAQLRERLEGIDVQRNMAQLPCAVCCYGYCSVAGGHLAFPRNGHVRADRGAISGLPSTTRYRTKLSAQCPTVRHPLAPCTAWRLATVRLSLFAPTAFGKHEFPLWVGTGLRRLGGPECAQRDSKEPLAKRQNMVPVI